MKQLLKVLRIASLMFLFICFTSVANDSPDGDKDRVHIDFSTINHPKPQIMVDEPVAEYNTATGTLTITLDASCYSEYTITLSSGYANIFNATTNRKHLPTQRE